MARKTIDDIGNNPTPQSMMEDVDANFVEVYDAVALNTTHKSSDGSDHSDVELNNTHRGSDGSDHSLVSTALQNLVEDTTPQLYDDLDAQGNYILDAQNFADLQAKGPGYWFDGGG